MDSFSNHPRCKTCKHFYPTEDGLRHGSNAQDVPLAFGVCYGIWHATVVAEWADKTEELKAAFETHLAAVADAEGYHASLHPHPDFYCPMHSDLTPDLAIDGLCDLELLEGVE